MTPTSKAALPSLQQQQQRPTGNPAAAAPRPSATLTYEEISKLFSLPIAEAASILGVCTSVLKRICRELGIVRWPYRKFVSGKNVEDIKRDPSRDRTKEQLDLSKAARQINDVSNVIGSTSVGSSINLQVRGGMASHLQDSKLQQGIPVVGHVSQPQVNMLAQNGWPILHPSQTKNIPTFMDDFIYGFPTNGLSSVSTKWWDNNCEDDKQKTSQGDSATQKDENQEICELSNENLTSVTAGDEPDSSAEDNTTVTTPSALLCTLRRKAVEYGRTSLKSELCIGCRSYKLDKRQKHTLLQVFRSSMPDEWMENYSLS